MAIHFFSYCFYKQAFTANKKRAVHCVYGAILLLLALFGISSGACAAGVPLVVTNTTNNLDGSLRQVIADAAPGDTIVFNIPTTDPGYDAYTGRWTITLTTGELLINKDLTINGPGADIVTIDRSTAYDTPEFRIFNVASGVTASISGLTIARGKSPQYPAPNSDGGGIYSEGTLTVSNSTFSGNSAGYSHGGGIYQHLGTLTVLNSTFSNNFAGANGGGIYQDGGIYSEGTLTVLNSTFSNNTAYGNGGGGICAGTSTISNSTFSNNFVSGAGGGINVSNSTISHCTFSDNVGTDYGGGIYASGTSAISNSTFFRNSTWYQYGGGIYIFYNGYGISTIRNCTITGNTAPTGKGSGVVGGNIISSIIAGNTNDAAVASTDSRYNIIGGTAAAAGLDPNGLQNNGGPTPTIALMPGSPAIDRGKSVSSTDQRGLARRYDNPAIANASGGDGSDVGAFEVQAPPSLSISDVTVTEGPAQGAPAGTSNATFTVTLSRASAQTITVNYATANGTATQPGDYSSQTGTLSFAVGETSKTILVPIVADYVVEADESFRVNLSGAVNAPIADGQGNGTITNDDNDIMAPTVRFTTSATTPAGTTPVNGSTISGAMPTITGEAADSENGVAKVELRLHRVVNSVTEFWSGTSWGTTQVKLAATLNPASGGANVSWSKGAGWPTGGNLSEGTYYLTAYATDKAAKVASASSNFKVLSDTVVPTVSFTTASTTPAGTTPVNGSTIYNAMPTITGVAADSSSGIAKVELRLHRVVNSVVEFWNGTAWGTTQVKFAATLDPTTGGANVSWSKGSGWPTDGNLTDGTYYLTAYATDKVGNVASASSNFKKATNTSGSISGSEMLSASDVKCSAGEAWVSNQSIRLSFSGALEQVTAENRANYNLSVEGQTVALKSAVYDKATHTITLLLAEGTLQAGDSVNISWSLRDAAGAPVQGQAKLYAQ